MRYSRRQIPVEIEVESEALTSDMIPKVLGSILEQLNIWIDMVLSKSDVEGGVSYGRETAPPGSAAAEQLATSTEDPT